MYGFGQRYAKPTSGGTPKGYMKTAMQQKAADQRAAYLAKQRQIGVAGLRRAQLGKTGKSEKKTFDVGGVTPILIFADTDTPVADSANGYLLQGAAATASAVVINQVPQGTTSNTRVGRRFRMRALHVRFNVVASTTAGIANQAVSIALVLIRTLDRGTTTMPPQNVVFRSQNAQTLTNIDNAERFKILRRWDFAPSGDSNTAGSQTGSNQFCVDEMVKFKQLETSFTQADTSGSFNDMEKGALCIYVRGTSGLATSSNIVTFVSRLYFEDI